MTSTAAVKNESVKTLEAELQEQALAVSTQLGELKITDQSSYDKVSEFLTKTLKPVAQKIADYFNPDIATAHQLHKSLNEKKKALLAPLERAESQVKGMILDWTREQERLRQEEQARLEREAREKEDEERLRTAIHAEEAGASKEETEVILNEPAYNPPPVAPPTFYKAAGVSVKQNWRGECNDVLALAKWVVANPKHINLIEPNLPAINSLAKAMRQSFNVDGCRAFDAGSVAGRAK
jgi:hypothetical protein